MQWMMLDVVCQRLVIARDRLVVPLARVAKSITLHSTWQAFGYARASDFTREQLQRSSRWLRELAALDDALHTLPGLADALCGDDGQPAIGRSAAALIGRVATPESLAAWIDLARLNTVRALRDEVARARSAIGLAATHRCRPRHRERRPGHQNLQRTFRRSRNAGAGA